MNAQSSHEQRLREVAERLSLGLDDDRPDKLVRKVTENGIGLAVGLTLLSVELERDLATINIEDLEPTED